MIKQIGAALFLIVLVGFIVYNEVGKEETDTSGELQEYDASGDPSQEGTSMTPPNAPSGLQVGDQAPDFELETLDGESVKLSELKGQKVFLNFWATWCPPCKEEMPEMEKFHNEYGDEVVVLAVNATETESNESDVDKYIEEEGYTFPVLLDKDSEVNNDYQAMSIPTTYFIGTDGQVQEPRKVGPMSYDFMIEMKDALN
ncbi:thiol:disulfide interchange protein tlpA [Halobacillus andaensis]|uniref:Thiol:disulfide interchange protein tlpA n=1 Tax=Halobacillus andaensis TaxID=1176239 RepID=A0A917AYC0_HALAA|nr:TlpA disulfide reductase family protein [Halobacillus andaensis]MBP2003391.1 peroxiredoxin [Halobacillus andaensis]GGF10276.1 thiol:disulfide interchange protein tlpA [Halobacillus andaensis]